MKRCQEAGFLSPRCSKITETIEGKGKEKKKQRGEGKEEKRKKAMAALVGFIIATLEIVFGGEN